jgi:hypothetical protein
MDWIMIIAVVGLVLFWTCLFLVPLMIVRGLRDTGHARRWSLAAAAAFLFVLLGFTRTMAGGTLGEALLWSLAWLVPIAVSFYARWPSGTRWRRADLFLTAAALATFLPANLVLLPTAILLLVRTVLWA